MQTIGDVEKARRNREKFPELAKLIDDVRVHFPKAKIVKIHPKGWAEARLQATPLLCEEDVIEND